jgi:Chlorophyll A-B binding protein
MATTASGFTSSSLKSHLMSLKMSDPNEEEILPMTYETPIILETPRTTSSMSQALPFMTRPRALDGSMVGDVGFDPLGFAKTKDDLVRFREAEIKHSRLAMLVSRFMPSSNNYKFLKSSL